MPRDQVDVPVELRQRLVERAREFRRQPTRTEAMLWAALRGGRLGARFRRQQPLGPFVVDFLCWEHKFIIEVDGAVHAGQRERDAAREELLVAGGYRVLRFTAREVEQTLPSVLDRIAHHLARPSPPAPSPAGRGELADRHRDSCG